MRTDALHTQREHALYIDAEDAHYLLIVKSNQPSLHARLRALPQRDIRPSTWLASKVTIGPRPAA